MISYSFWQRRFAGAADVIGRSITISRVPFTIVGVTPPEFFGPEVGRSFDVAIPIGTEPLLRGKESALDRRSTWWLDVIVRLKPGQSADAATTALRGVQPLIREATIPEDWRPEDQTDYFNEPFTLARRGGRHLGSAQPLPDAAHRHHGRRRAGAADCLREYRQPAAGAGNGAPSRDQRAPRARCLALAARAAVAGRKPGALAVRRRCRAVLRALGQPAAGPAALDLDQHRVPRPRTRLARPGLHDDSSQS